MQKLENSSLIREMTLEIANILQLLNIVHRAISRVLGFSRYFRVV